MMKKTSIFGIILLLALSSWAQTQPYFKKKSKFQAPKFYVLMGNDSLAQQPLQDMTPAMEEELMEDRQAVTSSENAEEATPAEVIGPSEALMQHEEIFSVQNQKIDSLLGQIALVRQQLQTLEAGQTQAKADTIYHIDSLRVNIPVPTESTASMPAIDYRPQFQKLASQLDSLKAQVRASEQKMDKRLQTMSVPGPQAAPATSSQPIQNPAAAAGTGSSKESLVDPKLLAQVEKQNTQVEALEKKMDRYAVNHADGIEDLRRSNREIQQRLDQIMLTQSINSSRTASPQPQPQVTVVAPRDSTLSKQMAAIQLQLANKDAATAGEADSLLSQQFELLNRQMAMIEGEQQALRLDNAQLRQQKDSLAALLAAKPKIVRDTITKTQVQVKTDTLRLKTEVLGLQKTNIYFQKGSAKLFDADLPVLVKLADQLLAHPDLVLYLRGFADNLSGSAAANLRLSEARAQQLKTFFQEKGVEEKRLIVESYGSQAPVYKNSLDRRVELEVKTQK